jgi:hypothetical protein
MKPVDPDKTEIALGNRRIDVRTTWRSITNKPPEWELRLAKAYWLEKIQPYIAGRKLQGAELYIAAEAHCWLQGIAKYANDWNKSEAGKKSPISAEIFPEWEKDEFREPEELVAHENLKPEILAGIAASLQKTGRKKMAPVEVVRNAHELFMAAEQYIGTLPKQKQLTGSLIAHLELEYSKVTFDEILQSNEKKSGHLPLLPPVQTGRNDGRLTMNALKNAVRRFLKTHSSSVTQEDFEREEQSFEMNIKKCKGDRTFPQISRLGNGKSLTYQEWQKQNQDSIKDCLENERISPRLISTLRWERFKNHWQDQQSRAQKRKSSESKRTTKSESKTILPHSAASSPVTAGKSKQ